MSDKNKVTIFTNKSLIIVAIESIGDVPIWKLTKDRVDFTSRESGGRLHLAYVERNIVEEQVANMEGAHYLIVRVRCSDNKKLGYRSAIADMWNALSAQTGIAGWGIWAEPD
ncbi:hypothetical protein O6H91_16G092200 [Diphasiastrum complanatum]|uniref:Uncharacterized protein n=1 Tax=Diphasiastrum complanatum TaxID=34168 RepID=A0ACC2BET2_DIPCM|nr:hypothetical protein O6H91_16G092200 [Diphasiastrum complanatum]